MDLFDHYKEAICAATPSTKNAPQENFVVNPQEPKALT